MSSDCYLGIDVGSISANVVLIDSSSEVVFSDYRRVDGSPVVAVQQSLSHLRQIKKLSAVVDYRQCPRIGRNQMQAVVHAFDVLVMRLIWSFMVLRSV